MRVLNKTEVVQVSGGSVPWWPWVAGVFFPPVMVHNIADKASGLTDATTARASVVTNHL